MELSIKKILEEANEKLAILYDDSIRQYLINKFGNVKIQEVKESSFYFYEPELLYFISGIEFINNSYKIYINIMLFDKSSENKGYKLWLTTHIHRKFDNHYHYLNDDEGELIIDDLKKFEQEPYKILEQLWEEIAIKIEEKYSDELLWQIGIENLVHIVDPVDIQYSNINFRLFRLLLNQNTWKDIEYNITESPILLTIKHNEYYSLGLFLPSHIWVFMPKFFKKELTDKKEYESFISFIKTRDFDIEIHEVNYDYQKFKTILSKYNKSSLLRKDKELEFMLQVCREIHTKIPKYQDKSLTLSDYFDFISQFPDEYKNYALKLLRKLRFISFEKMKTYLINLIDRIVPDYKDAVLILFDSSWQKSSDAWSYFIRKFSGAKLNIIKTEDFLKDLKKRKKNKEVYYIFLDDIIGSGKQIISAFEEELGDDLQEIEGILKQYMNINIFLIAGVGTFKSKSIISTEISILNKSNIRYEINLRDIDKAFHVDNWKDLKLLEGLKAFLKEIEHDWWNGYNECELLIVFEWNTPNNSIACLWKKSEHWKPLFPRV